MTFPLLPLCVSLEEVSSIVDVIGRALYALPATYSVNSLVDVIKQTSTDVSILDSENTLTIVDAVKLLNAGVSQIFVHLSLVNELHEAGIDRSRLILITDDLNADVTSASGVCIDSNAASFEEIGSLAKMLSSSLLEVGGPVQCYVNNVRECTTLYSPAIPIVDIRLLTTETFETEKIAVGEFFVSGLKTDRPDGLFTTLVVDENEKCLGLVYSSRQSIFEAIRTQTGVYHSRRHGLWYKGATSGAVQKLIRLDVDCDNDCIKATVVQDGPGFCHNNTSSCFGNYTGVSLLEKTLVSRKKSAPEGSYTARLFNDEKLLRAKIMEEAEELTEAKSKDEVAWEAADLIYFVMTKLVQEGVSWADVEANLDSKHFKVSRRKGDAKPKWIEKTQKKEEVKSDEIKMQRLDVEHSSAEDVENVLTRPVQKTSDIMKLVTPIIEDVQKRGDLALIDLTAKFDKAVITSPVINSPFPDKLMNISEDVKKAIDLSISNVEKFHAAQISDNPLSVETVPGVVCSRFSRPIESVGLYVPGGTAVLPSTALMLGVPAQVAGCKNIIIASPPRSDGTPTPEVVYVAHKVGAKAILLAGGAQAVAAMAYGTQSVPKVDKIMGPGNQFVTAAKMFVQNDTRALVSIDMPAGPSEVLVIADKTSNPVFVASDLLSQAEHGVDSQVILIAVDLNEKELSAIETELHEQAIRLPRVDIVRGSIAHSTTLCVNTIQDALKLSNKYGPEHLILQIHDAAKYVSLVDNAGSVFVGPYSPESCGDYSSGTNHTLPTYGYAKMYSGVNTQTFMKHITSQELTVEGLKNIGQAVMTLAAVEGLDAHKNAVKVRLDSLEKQ